MSTGNMQQIIDRVMSADYGIALFDGARKQCKEPGKVDCVFADTVETQYFIKEDAKKAAGTFLLCVLHKSMGINKVSLEVAKAFIAVEEKVVL